MSVLRLAGHYALTVILLFLFSLEILRRILTRRRAFFSKKNRTTPPPCLNDPALGVHHNIQLKDVTLHYVESGPSDGQLMLFIHGFPEFWYSWRHQILAFKATHRVVAVDTRGYGGSSKPRGVSQYTVAKVREDMAQLIQHLQAGSDRKCVVISHDWGGAICWSLAAHHPHLVERVVIMNSPHLQALDGHRNSSWLRSIPKAYMYLVDLPWLIEWFCLKNDLELIEFFYRSKLTGVKDGRISDEHIETYKYTFNSMGDLTGPVNYIRAHARGLHTQHDLGHVGGAVPVLLLWGTKDRFLPQKMAERSRDFAENFQLVLVEGASHWVQQDEPDIVNDHISKFLKK